MEGERFGMKKQVIDIIIYLVVFVDNIREKEIYKEKERNERERERERFLNSVCLQERFN